MKSQKKLFDTGFSFAMSVWSFGCLRLILEALCARKLEFGASVEYRVQLQLQEKKGHGYAGKT